MTGARAAPPVEPDDRFLGALLASDPLEWARCVTLLVYEQNAARLAARADGRARRLDNGGDHAHAATVRRDAVNLLRHACTNYEELVADIAAHYGRGRRDDVIRVIRHRVLGALAQRFPCLADACRAVAAERRSPSNPVAPEVAVPRA